MRAMDLRREQRRRAQRSGWIRQTLDEPGPTFGVGPTGDGRRQRKEQLVDQLLGEEAAQNGGSTLAQQRRMALASKHRDDLARMKPLGSNGNELGGVGEGSFQAVRPST